MAGIADRITQPDKPEAPAICIYGRVGVGKTTLLGTMPDLWKMLGREEVGWGLVVDVPIIEGGTFVLAPHAGIDVDILKIQKWDELDETYRFLKEGGHKYKWGAIDTVTSTQELAKRKIVKERELSADPHQITQPEWGKVGMLNAEMVWRFRSLKMPFVFVAHEKVRTDDLGVSKECLPDLSPASIPPLLRPMTLVGRLFVSEVVGAGDSGQNIWEHRLWTGPNNTYVTKTRAVPGRPLPEVIKNPNLGQIAGYLMGLDVPCPEAAEQGLIL